MAAAFDVQPMEIVTKDIDFNKLIIEYHQNRDIVELMIECAIYAYTCPRAKDIFTPLPPSWLARGIDTIEKSTSLGIITNFTKIIELLNSTENDMTFIEFTNRETYDFILFIIEGNQTLNMSKVPNLISSLSESEMIKSKIFKTYKMAYSEDIERQFKTKDTKYLFHGSRFENWYSIMRSGIKIGSTNKKLFLNGAVYGNGIYLSDSASFSLGYSSSLSTSQTSIMSICILAVYEVIFSTEYLKANNIYVIPDEEALILRYIIVGSYEAISKHSEKIDNRFVKNDGVKMDREMEKKKESEMIARFSRRLMIEYKRFLKIQEREGIELSLPDPENLRLWRIRIFKIDNPILEQEMRDVNIQYIEMECIFNDDYPISAPFPRIITPRFQIHTGHITSGGSFCMEAISPTGWCPATSMESLILQIRMVISDGKAHIDKSRYSEHYTLEDAKQFFNIAMDTHKWSK